MDNLDAAKTIHRLFKPVLKATSVRARNGDHKAALNIMRLMAAENVALKALGYRTTDTGGRLVKLRTGINPVMVAAMHELAHSAEQEDDDCVTCGEGEEL